MTLLRRWIGTRRTVAFPTSLPALTDMRAVVRRFASKDGIPSGTADEVVLAVSEACSNAVLHSGSDVVRITWTVRRDCVRVRVDDDGTFRRVVVTPGETGGRGFLIMMAVMDEVSVHEGTERHPGTTVRLVRCRGR